MEVLSSTWRGSLVLFLVFCTHHALNNGGGNVLFLGVAAIVQRKSVRFVVVGRSIIVRSPFIAVILYHFDRSTHADGDSMKKTERNRGMEDEARFATTRLQRKKDF